MRWLQAAAFMLIMIFAVSCTPAAEPANTAQNEQNVTATQPSDPANQGLVARVNGVGIAQAAYDRALARLLTNSNAADRSALERQVLDTLIEQELINQAAPTLGVVITDENVQAELANLQSIAGNAEQWQQYLTLNGYTEQEMAAAQRDLLVTQGVRDALMSGYSGAVEQVNARHIVVRTQEEAETVMNRLEAGEGFATLAAEYSIDSTTRETGGNLDWFARSELFYANLEEIAFTLEIGQIAGPIATGLGYHVIQTLDKQQRPIEPERIPMLSENIFNNWLDSLYRSATIERYLQW